MLVVVVRSYKSERQTNEKLIRKNQYKIVRSLRYRRVIAHRCTLLGRIERGLAVERVHWVQAIDLEGYDSVLSLEKSQNGVRCRGTFLRFSVNR